MIRRWPSRERHLTHLMHLERIRSLVWEYQKREYLGVRIAQDATIKLIICNKMIKLSQTLTNRMLLRSMEQIWTIVFLPNKFWSSHHIHNLSSYLTKVDIRKEAIEAALVTTTLRVTKFIRDLARLASLIITHWITMELIKTLVHGARPLRWQLRVKRKQISLTLQEVISINKLNLN